MSKYWVLSTEAHGTLKATKHFDAGMPREIENEKTVIFIKGTRVEERATGVMKDLVSFFLPLWVTVIPRWP